MTSKCLSGVLIIALSLFLCMPAEAQTSSGTIGGVGTGTIVGVVVGVVVGVAVIAIVAVHYSKKRAITGCVNSAENGMTVTDEKDKRLYTLAGNTAGIKPGDRMTLQGRTIRPKDTAKTLVWETKKIAKDLGVCQP